MLKAAVEAKQNVRMVLGTGQRCSESEQNRIEIEALLSKDLVVSF
jgi:hypothetical protein